MGSMTDEQLVEQFQRTGELQWFDSLVQRHIGKVRAMVYPAILNHSDADDLAQEIFLRALRGIHGFRGRAAFTTWLYRIAVNTTHSFLKRRRREPSAFAAELPERADPAAGPHENASANEANHRVEAAMSALPPACRTAITLIAIEGMDVKEAARVSGCLVATMYWRLHEARKRLRQSLSQDTTP